MIITDNCLSCESCTDLCPEKAIRRKNIDNPYSRMMIDPDKCNDCKKCVDLSYCPGDAIQLK